MLTFHLSAGPAALSEGASVSQKQVCDDISRRLALLQEQWAGGKLSIPVKKRMAILVQGMGGLLNILDVPCAAIVG